eukprot:scaffold63462_cov71-Attheya_sp.AAC.2
MKNRERGSTRLNTKANSLIGRYYNKTKKKKASHSQEKNELLVRNTLVVIYNESSGIEETFRILCVFKKIHNK